jgi:RNA polymerase sigma factor (sigma-70 family)
MPPNPPANPTGQYFPATCWTVVQKAQGDGEPARAALEELCRIYWAPVYAFIRRNGRAPADAEDLTQGFFAELLARDSLGQVAAEHGRLRTFLLKAVTRHMINQHAKATAAKRGHGVPLISLDTAAVEGQMKWEPGHSLTPDVEFARQWGLGLLDRAFARVEAREANLGRPGLFQDLKGIISLDSATAPYAEIATRHGLSEGAVKVAAHRLRQSFRQALRDIIAETVASEEEIDDEIQELFQVFQS